MNDNSMEADEDIPASEILKSLEQGKHNFAEPGLRRFPFATTSLRSCADRSEQQMEGIPTGFSDLDRVLGGVRPGQVVTFVGDPGGGSTALALNLMRKSLKQQSLPESKHLSRMALYTPRQCAPTLVERLVCAEARVDTHRLRTGQLVPAELLRLYEARSHLLGSGLRAPSRGLILDQYGMSVAELCRWTGSLSVCDRLDVLVIDGIEALGVETTGTAPGLLQTMEQLKEMAIALDIAVIALCHFPNDRREFREDPPVSGQVAPAVALISDTLVLLHRPNYWQPLFWEDGLGRADETIEPDKGLELITAQVAHQSQGPRATVFLAFNPRYSRIDTVRWNM